MELKEIRQIVELMNRHNLSLFHLQKEGFSLKLRKGADLEELLPLLRSAAGAAEFPLHGSSKTPPPAPAEEPDDHATETAWEEITSPMVGTLYRSPAPDSGPFVDVGSEIEKGATVCIIEAMKVMNEIKADVSGRIEKILVDDGSPVQYGQPLFLVNPR
ncbi:MAG TPA: acetyl-CoA carboxylase biotin carboxyl carrier protein [Verrucomicrobiales bacterium]|nr:acetyl-CoA carboxylase biotin carboxyl carrier protein [Verrucomicrobiales bacterium]